MHNKQGPNINPQQNDGGNNKQWINKNKTIGLERSTEVTVS